jgi:hypothetical protein
MARFAPGKSGNPAGRPPGRGAAAQLRTAIEKAAPDVLAAVIDAAKEGDMTAARLLLDRACPPLRAVDLPAVVDAPADADLGTLARAILAAAVAGRLSPDAASGLLAAVGGAVRAVELVDIERRIAALELKEETNGINS